MDVPADVVVGQPNMTANTAGHTASLLNDPSSVSVVNGSLLVADTGNNRVLIWNTIPTSNGTPANVVVGQPNLNTGTPGVLSSSLSAPIDAQSDGTRLIISDENNLRVLIWNTIPTSNGAPANLVLGQPDFISNSSSATSATTFCSPQYIAVGTTRLAITDGCNNRVLVWNSIPTANQTPPDVVLGQPDMVSNLVNNNGSGSSIISAFGFNSPRGVYLNGPNELIVGENGNSRWLIFYAK